VEVQDGAPTGKGVAHGKACTVPALTAKIRLVRIAGIVPVEAVGQDSGLPFGVVFRVPDFADSAERALTKLPA
jgi:hypothetical protein